MSFIYGNGVLSIGSNRANIRLYITNTRFRDQFIDCLMSLAHNVHINDTYFGTCQYRKSGIDITYMNSIVTFGLECYDNSCEFSIDLQTDQIRLDFVQNIISVVDEIKRDSIMDEIKRDNKSDYNMEQY